MAEYPSTAKSSEMGKIATFCYLCVITILTTSVQAATDDPSGAYDVLYSAAVEHYNQEKWSQCLSLMTRALDDFHSYQDSIIECRVNCQIETPANTLREVGDEYIRVDLTFFELSLKRSNCLRRCKEKKFGSRPESVSKEIQDAFEDLKPYDYLQYCAFQMENYELAVSSAVTFLEGHPDHEVMTKNVNFYRSLDFMKPEYFRNLEYQPHKDHYTKGVAAYEEEDWAQTVRHFEAALTLYYPAYRRCEARCEGQYDHGSWPDLYNAIADHWITVLRCRQQCPTKLATIGGKVIEHHLAEHFHYLQFAYYKLGEVKQVGACVESYLLLNPDDPTMTRNQDYYSNAGLIQMEDFTARKTVVAHFHMLQSQLVMQETLDNYKFSDADTDLLTPTGGDGRLAATVMGADATNNAGATIKAAEYGNPTLNTSIFGDRNAKFKEELEAYKSHKGIQMVGEEDTLKGSHRVAVDGLLSPDECSTLVALASIGGVVGDGYRSDGSSPHTSYEKFAGLTVGRAAELVAEGSVKEASARAYLSASEKARGFMARYFNLQVPLFFHYTHLVCREARSDQNQEERDDLSHPVHADNCYIQDDGTCLKKSPAYVQRDFSGLLYLNDEFEGGNFFFAHKNQTVQESLRPQCGRFVGFEASDYHGVLAVKKGRRCAVAMWYTLDPLHQEAGHAQASTLLASLHQNTNQKLEKNPELKELMSEKGYKLLMTEAELNGPKRFAADLFITPEQCKMLRDLASTGGVSGDGYKKKSPHTVHEDFAGMTVDRAAQAGGIKGDGYRGAEFPHTENEMFEGLTILRAAQLAASQKVSVDAVQLYLDTSEEALKFLKTYFKIKEGLYFDFTHMACRKALDGDNWDRMDLSHPVHSDNCHIQPDNSCPRVPPAYTQRDYSALLYLNDDFDGGEFFFTHKNMTIASSLKPRCGRLVGFDAGNYHGVKAVMRGQRCALAMWYTLDSRFKEAAHGISRNILRDLDGKPMGPGNPEHVEL